MTSLVSLKAVRLLFAVTVSFWLAGGCLLACGSMAMAAQSNQDQAAGEAESCQSAQEHHCCSKSNPEKQSTIDSELTESLFAIESLPPVPVSECPLAVSAAAVVAKASSNSPVFDQATYAALPFSAGARELRPKHFTVPLVPNRGPTYLRCCVFLI